MSIHHIVYEVEPSDRPKWVVFLMDLKYSVWDELAGTKQLLNTNINYRTERRVQRWGARPLPACGFAVD